MKPMLVNGKLEVHLHKADVVQLQKTRELGELLMQLYQTDEGEMLIEAVDAILHEYSHL